MNEQLISSEVQKKDSVEDILQKLIDDAFIHRAVLSEQNNTATEMNIAREKTTSGETTGRSKVIVEGPYLFGQIVSKAVEKIFSDKSDEEKYEIVDKILLHEFLYNVPSDMNKHTKLYLGIQFIEDKDNKTIGFKTFIHTPDRKNIGDALQQQLIQVPIHKQDLRLN